MTSILITGGTGYFGQGFVRRLLAETEHDKKYGRICIYSRGEYAQALMRQAIPDPDQRLRWFIGDVRDLPRLKQAMRSVEVVVHAAALKRVEVGETNPMEMIKTNVLGTMNLIEAAQADEGEHIRPRRVVVLSTDKACAPLNAYGATKLTVEKLTIAANNTTGQYGPRFAVVRYGNVSGSTGSVIPTWRAALAGDPNASVRLTDPLATRFWMSLGQAIDLVLGTIASMKGGEFVVPDLPAYRLIDLAQAMDIKQFKIVGLGKGEKMHEEMISAHEASLFSRSITDSFYWEHCNFSGAKPHAGAVSSETTTRLSVAHLRELLKDVR